MADNSFEINGTQFKISKINAMKQFHIVRRIGPILSRMTPAMQKIAKANESGMSEDDKLQQFVEFAAPIMDGLSELSDKDSEFVLNSLLSAVEIQQSGGNWAKLVIDNNLMFSSLELPILLQAAGRAFMYNMTGFFGVLQQTSR